MSDEIKNGLKNLLDEREREFNERINAQQELMASPAYQSELKFIKGLTYDVVDVLRLCLAYSGRAGKLAEHSLVIRSTDDLGQSVVAALHLQKDGLINPIKRELRYIIESSVKYLYVDQQTQGSTFDSDLNDRLEFLENRVGSSIDVLDELKLHGLHPEDEKHFKAEVYDAYRKSCAYVHVSRQQIEERLKRIEKGFPAGFESVDDLRKIGRLMFRVYDIALVLYFHGFGLPMTGDLFLQVLDDLPKWRFHKGKYVSIISGYFDYKHERKTLRYADSKSTSSEDWPPKRL